MGQEEDDRREERSAGEGERKRMKKSSDKEMKDGLSVMEGIKRKKLKTERSEGAVETTVVGGGRSGTDSEML